MSKKHWLVLVLFILPFPLGEMYMFFDDEKLIYPWLYRAYHHPVTLAYYVDKLSNMVIGVIYVGMTFFFKEVRRLMVLNLAAKLSFVYVCFDLFMFMVNHNDFKSYVFAYSNTLLITLLVYWMNGEFHRLKELQNIFRHKIEEGVLN